MLGATQAPPWDACVPARPGDPQDGEKGPTQPFYSPIPFVFIQCWNPMDHTGPEQPCSHVPCCVAASCSTAHGVLCTSHLLHHWVTAGHALAALGVTSRG